MYIGQLAEKSGVSPRAIRLYESIGLLPKPQRKGRYRVYGPSDLDLLLLIREAKLLGISLKRMQQAIVIRHNCVDWVSALALLEEMNQVLLAQRAEIDLKLARLACCRAEIEKSL